jgi:hypothetical protein
MSELTPDQGPADAAAEDGADPGKPASAPVEEPLAEGELELGFFSRGLSEDHLLAASERQSDQDLFFDPARARRRQVAFGFCGLLVVGMVGLGVRSAFTERSLRPAMETTPALTTAQSAAPAPAPAAMPAELVPPVGDLQQVVSVDQLRARVPEGPMPEGSTAPTVAIIGPDGQLIAPAQTAPGEPGNGSATAPAAAPAGAATPATTAPVPTPPAATGTPAPAAAPAGAGTSAAPAVVDPGAGLWAASAPARRPAPSAAPTPTAPVPAATPAAVPSGAGPALDKKREAAPADKTGKSEAAVPGGDSALAKAPASPTMPAGSPTPASSPAPAGAATPAAASSDKLSACTGVLRSGRFKERFREVDSKCRAAFQAAPAATLAAEIAQAALEHGRNADAASWARRAIGVDPKYANAFVLLGGAEQQMGHPAEARAAYSRYLELAPNGEHAQDVRALLPRLAGM